MCKLNFYGPVIRQYLVVIVANFGLFQMGASIAWMSPVMVILRSENQTTLPQPLTEEEMSWILSLGLIVDFFAFGLVGYLADRIGRKYTIVAACVPRILECCLFLCTSQVWMILLARGLSGLADTLVVHSTVTYTSEFANKEIRGGLGTVSQIMSSLGGLIMLVSGPYASYSTINVILTSIVVVTSIPMLFLPESPYYLYSKGRFNKSLKMLIYLRGSEASAIAETNEYSNYGNQKIDKRQLLKDKNNLKTLFKVIFLCICYGCTGYTTAQFHLQTIFEMTQSDVSSQISSVVIGFIAVIACCCTWYTSDNFGRKPVLIASLTGLGLGMVGLGIFFRVTQDYQEIKGFLNYLPLVSIGLIIFSFNAGFGALFWLQLAELFDGRLRAVGVSIGGTTVCVSTFITVRFLQSIIDGLGPVSTYWMFGGSCVGTALFIFFFIPETNGKTFSEIQKDLRNEFVNRC